MTYDGSTLLNSQPTTMTQSHSFSSTHKSRTVHQGEDYTKTDKPSPGTPLKVTRGQTTLSEYVCENGWDISDPRDSTTIHHVRNKQPSDKVFLGQTDGIGQYQQIVHWSWSGTTLTDRVQYHVESQYGILNRYSTLLSMEEPSVLL